MKLRGHFWVSGTFWIVCRRPLRDMPQSLSVFPHLRAQTTGRDPAGPGLGPGEAGMGPRMIRAEPGAESECDTTGDEQQAESGQRDAKIPPST